MDRGRIAVTSVAQIRRMEHIQPLVEASTKAVGGRPDPLHQLMTVDDVAALLRVRRSWIYERTRKRNSGSSKDRLPFVKVGKFVRFDPAAVAEFVARCSRHDRTR